MSSIDRIVISDNYRDLIRGYSDFKPSDYSEKLRETLAIEDFEERILALHELYLIYEKKTIGLCVLIPDDTDDIVSDEIEKIKKEFKHLNSEKKVISNTISSMLKKYNDVHFPSDGPISNVSFLIRKKLISQHI